MNLVADKPDLLDHAILLRIERISKSQNKEAIDASPVGDVLIKFVEDGFKIKQAGTLDVEKETFWKGSASELLALLDECASYYKINIKSKTWPKNANVLTRRINEIKTNLQEEGIVFGVVPS